MYHIVICDHSIKFITFLKSIFKKLEKERKSEYKIYEYNSDEDLIGCLNKEIGVDLLILDMQLVGMDIDEIIKMFHARFPNVMVILSSRVRKADIQSSKKYPIRYIFKDQNHQEIIVTIEAVMEEIEKLSTEPFIIAHYRRNIQKIKLKDVLYIESSKRGGRLFLHPACKEDQLKEILLVDKKPEELSATLEKYGFALSQISYLVNMHHIVTISGDEVVFDTGEVFKIGRMYQKSFKDAFLSYYSDKYI